MADIAARRIEAETRLVEMKHMQGVALLDGQDFDGSSLIEIERELSGLDAAEGEAMRRHWQLPRQSGSVWPICG
ncbi:hypothetical protein [Mesorhizobium sp. M0488]|uniref:hypothetical protein n=1 Tax=unclassified Mesorhizobium TaxID=325217 RepID=UPI003336941E